ncbi:MAG: phosphatase PAP2 family protein [Cytophagales bacterium]|nr:phosphatase PAP2 family protein [Cytophagales bacterium]
MKLSTVIKENKTFYITCFLVLLLGIYPLVTATKIEIFLAINGFHHTILDHFFYYITFLGSGVTYLLLLIILLLRKFDNRKLVIGMGSFLVMSVVVQFMKRCMFANQLRPTQLIPLDITPHLVEGVSLNSHHSFPSGHSASIFSLVCFVNLITKPKQNIYSFLMVLLATTIAYSRVYLAQHFYEDIYVGAWIGVLTTTFVYTTLVNLKSPQWLDKKLLA